MGGKRKSQPSPIKPDLSKITYTVPRKRTPGVPMSSLPKTRQVTVKTSRGR